MLTDTDRARLTNAQQGVVTYATNLVQNATTAEERANAHALAESVRNAAGYYSNADGTYGGELRTQEDNYNALLEQAIAQSQANTAKAQELTEKQWKFNADEAQKNRDWQEYMSNTSLQRMVADAKQAGINPVFLAGNGGASTPSGATASGASAQPDTSSTSLLGSYLNSLISSATAINNANINAKASLALGQINAQSASRVASIQTHSAQSLQDTANAFTERMTQLYPNNPYGVISSLVNGIAEYYGVDLSNPDTYKNFFDKKARDRVEYEKAWVENTKKPQYQP